MGGVARPRWCAMVDGLGLFDEDAAADVAFLDIGGWAAGHEQVQRRSSPALGVAVGRSRRLSGGEGAGSSRSGDTPGPGRRARMSSHRSSHTGHAAPHAPQGGRRALPRLDVHVHRPGRRQWPARSAAIFRAQLQPVGVPPGPPTTPPSGQAWHGRGHSGAIHSTPSASRRPASERIRARISGAPQRTGRKASTARAPCRCSGSPMRSLAARMSTNGGTVSASGTAVVSTAAASARWLRTWSSVPREGTTRMPSTGRLWTRQSRARRRSPTRSSRRASVSLRLAGCRPETVAETGRGGCPARPARRGPGRARRGGARSGLIIRTFSASTSPAWSTISTIRSRPVKRRLVQHVRGLAHSLPHVNQLRSWSSSAFQLPDLGEPVPVGRVAAGPHPLSLSPRRGQVPGLLLGGTPPHVVGHQRTPSRA